MIFDISIDKGFQGKIIIQELYQVNRFETQSNLSWESY